jgi:hypothetical protein
MPNLGLKKLQILIQKTMHLMVDVCYSPIEYQLAQAKASIVSSGRFEFTKVGINVQIDT